MKKPFKQLVYAIKNCDNGRIKIGITRDFTARLSSLRGSSGCELAVIYTSAHIHNAAYIEGQIHEHLSASRWGGEWFTIDSETAIRAIKYFIDGGVSYNNAININAKIEAKAIQLERYNKLSGKIYSSIDGSMLFHIEYKDGRWIVIELESINN